MSDDFRRELDELIEKLRRELDEVGRKVEEYLERGEVSKAYRVWRDSALDSLKALRSALDRIGESVKEVKMGEEELRKLASELRDRIREVVDGIEEIGERIRRARGGRSFSIWIWGPPLDELVRGVDLTIDSILKATEELVRGAERAVEDMGRRITQVVSVRIRDRDLEVIDKLVDAGIFRSRSEAVAFFTRKGIEASREWIEKALEQARRIKEIQESLRKEIEKGGEE
jgi:Arc/MetJ-type ribon-helix-helix transcriptional regulator